MGFQRTSATRANRPSRNYDRIGHREIKRNGRQGEGERRGGEGGREEDSDYDEMAYLNPEHVRRHTGATTSPLLPPSVPPTTPITGEEGGRAGGELSPSVRFQSC